MNDEENEHCSIYLETEFTSEQFCMTIFVVVLDDED